MAEEVTAVSPAVDQAEPAVASPDATAAAVQDANTAASSDAGKDAPEKSEAEKLFDVTVAALEQEKPKDKGEPSAPETAEPEKALKDLSEEDLQKALDDPKLPFHKHRRWIELRELNASYRQKASEAEAKAQQLAAKAQEFDILEDFRTKNRLEPQEIVDLYYAGALIKNDPAQGLVYLRGIVSNLERQLGEALPEDLHQAVDAGEMTEARARELSRLRATSQVQQQAIQAGRQAEQVRSRETMQREVISASQAWEAGIKTRDPDYAVKAEYIFDRVQAIAAKEGAPRTAAEVNALLDRAWSEVSTRLKTLPGRGPAATPPKPNGHATPPATRKPMTPEEITRVALGLM